MPSATTRRSNATPSGSTTSARTRAAEAGCRSPTTSRSTPTRCPTTGWVRRCGSTSSPGVSAGRPVIGDSRVTYPAVRPMTQLLQTDHLHLARAIEIAEGGRGRTSPNPMVGAVVVRDGEVLGEAFHTAHGHAHAEREALGAVGDGAA